MKPLSETAIEFSDVQEALSEKLERQKGLLKELRSSSTGQLKNYQDLLERCFIEEFETTLDELEKIIHAATSTHEVEDSFKTLAGQRWKTIENTALSPLANLDSPSNECFLEFFDLLFPIPPNDLPDYLQVFMPTVKKVVSAELVIERKPHPKSGVRHGIQHSITELSDENECLKGKELSELVIANGVALDVSSVASGDYSLYSKTYQFLSGKFPELYEKFKTHNSTIESIFKNVETLSREGITLREAITALRQELIKGGEKITSEKLASEDTMGAIQTFTKTFNLFPDEVKKELKPSGNSSLINVVKKLNEEPTQCVEIASDWLSNILDDAKNQKLLETTPSISPEERKGIEKEINVLGKFDDLNQGKETSTTLPFDLIEKVISGLEIDDIVAFSDLLSKFDNVEIYRKFLNLADTSKLLEGWPRGNLTTILVFLSVPQTKIFCEAMGDRWDRYTEKTEDFGYILNQSRQEQRTIIYDANKERLVVSIKTASDFKNVLKYLTPEQRAEIYLRFKETRKLDDIIKTASDFKDVSKYLTPEQRTENYEHLKKAKKLDDIIKTTSNFKDVSEYLTPEQRTENYEHLEKSKKLDDIITTAKSFNDMDDFLEYLTLKQFTEVCQVYQEKLCQLLKRGDLPSFNGERNFINFMKRFEGEKRTILYNTFKAKWKELYPSVKGLVALLELLTEEQRVEAYEANIDNIIRTLGIYCRLQFDGNGDNALASLLKYLPVKQCEDLCKRKEMSKEIEFLSSFDSLAPIFADLDLEQCKVVCRVFKGKIEGFFNIYGNEGLRTHVQEKFYKMMNSYNLSAEKFDLICQTGKEELCKLFKTSTDFSTLRRVCNNKGKLASIFKIFEEHLPEMVKTPEDLSNVVDNYDLTKEQRAEVYKKCKNQIMHNSSTFVKMVKPLRYALQIEIYEKYQDDLGNIVKTTEDSANIIKCFEGYFLNEQLEDFYQRCKKQIMPNSLRFMEMMNDKVLPTLLQKIALYEAYKGNNGFGDILLAGTDFVNIVNVLHTVSMRRDEFIGIYTQNVSGFVKTPQDLISVIKCLTLEQCSAMYEDNKDHLDGIIPTAEVFSSTIESETDATKKEVVTKLYSMYEKRLSAFVKKASDFGLITKYFNPDQKQEAYKACEKQLLQVVAKKGDLDAVDHNLTQDQKTEFFYAIKAKVDNFRKIYTDLRKTQSSFWKMQTDFLKKLDDGKFSSKEFKQVGLTGIEGIQSHFLLIKDHAAANPGSRTAEAFDLLQQDLSENDLQKKVEGSSQKKSSGFSFFGTKKQLPTDEQTSTKAPTKDR